MKATDADIDNLHHALGRPKRASAEPYRNYFCVEANSDLAARFEELGFWDFGRFINGGRDAIYHVNGAGKEVLAEWLETSLESGLFP